MVNSIKYWFETHKKIVMLIFVALCILIAIPFILNIFNSISEANKEEVVDENKVELSFEQQKIIDGYNDEIKSVVEILENSKWIDNSGLRALFIQNNQLIERNNGEETIQEYAVCSVEKESKDLTDSKSQYEYHISLLLPGEKYTTVTFNRINNGRSETSPLFSASITGRDTFKNSNEYFRVTNSDNFQLGNWESNANQFFDFKYDEMYKQLKEFCASNYPQVSNLEWNGEITINYPNNSVSATFNITSRQAYTIVCTYEKDKGAFDIRRGK